MSSKLVIVLFGLIWCRQSVSELSARDLFGDGEKTKIVGGVQISVEEAPYIVMLMYKGRQHCGGSIISHNFVISAAHCTEDTRAREYTVRSGTSKVGDGEDKYVSNIFQHPKYDNSNFDFDFTLIKIFGRFLYDKSQKTVMLPAADDESPEGELVRTLGWGYTLNPAESSDYLRSVELMIIKPDECEEAYKMYKIKVSHNKVCAVHPDRIDGRDACQGDSGGPLQRISDGKLIGVVSFGLGCGKASYAGIYAKISSVRSWIKQIAKV